MSKQLGLKVYSDHVLLRYIMLAVFQLTACCSVIHGAEMFQIES